MRRAWIVLCAVVLVAGLVAGCATETAMQNARTSLAQAKAAGAEKKAAFEYYAAEEFLKKANIEAEEGNYSSAEVLTKQSQEYSAKALQMAGGGAK